MSRKLFYFDLNGRAEHIRYILAYTNKKFDDVRYDRKLWPIKEVKDAMPFGQMPVYEEDGKVLHQSMAIARYLAANTELLPSDPWEQAQLDAAALTVFDFNTILVGVMREQNPEKKEELKKKLYNEQIVYYFSRFEKQLQKNNGYFGGKLSWADFILVGSVEVANMALKDNIEKNYPAIAKLVNTIPTLPGIKEYVAKRPVYAM